MSGEEALRLLFEAHQFSNVLSCASQTDFLLQLTPRLCTVVKKIVSHEYTLSLLVPVDRYHGYQNTVEMEGASEIGDGRVQLKALIDDVIGCCDAHVVSSACGLIRNVFLAFPDYMAAYLHHTFFLTQLTRCKHVCGRGRGES